MPSRYIHNFLFTPSDGPLGVLSGVYRGIDDVPLSMSSAESAASPGPRKPLWVARNTLAQSGTGLLQYALSFLSAPILLSAVGGGAASASGK